MRNEKFERFLFYSIAVFLPTQLGKHFWPSFSFVEGIRIDYLSPTLYLTDLLILLLFVTYISSRLFTHKVKISNKLLEISRACLRQLTDVGNWKFTVFVVFLLIGISFSFSPNAGLYKLLKIIEMVFLGFYIANNVSAEKDLQKLGVLFSI